MSAHRIPALTATTIGALQRGQHDAALAQHADGSLDVLPSLAEEALPDTTIVLREAARAWADRLVEDQRAAAEETPGASLNVLTLRKAAAAVATAQLRAEADAEDAALATPTVRLVPSLPLPRRSGRHAAPLSPQSRQAEEELYALLVLDVLEVLDPAA